ncbi:MAG: hypothetical protein JXA21_06795 [Anaerolineae bacterium]|nr:hypothetical protein [Anaerolineae bacterium]
MPRTLGLRPYVEDASYLYRRPLKYQNGSERVETVVVYASTVTPDNNILRRLLPAGTLLNKITSGVGLGKYGPYSKTASDGRQTLAAGTSYVLTESHDVTFGDVAVGGYYMDCVFDLTQVADSGAAGDAISKHGASLTALKAAFPQCAFK